jgi:riboflavin kinase/FMN adenylyltransferase
MNTYRLHTTDFRLPSTARAVAVGVFDGVHQAHREVIGRILGIRGLTSSVLTFADSVRSLPKEAFSLETAYRKAEILENLGVSELIQMEFAAFGGLSPEAFVREILCERLSAKVVACGENFRFGKGG